MVLRPQTVKDLRVFLGNKRTYGVYNILSALRGPDNHGNSGAVDEQHLKIITKALRKYIGLDSESCSGDLGYAESLSKLIEAIAFVDKAEQFGGKGTHYTGHLHHALDAVGRDNLINYMRQKTWMI